MRIRTLLFGLAALTACAVVALATGLVHPPEGVAHFLAGITSHAGDSLYSSLALASGAVPVLTSKNPKALELRAEADKQFARLTSDEVLSGTQVKEISDNVRALRARADLIAEFTPDAEITRQGGDDDITKLSPERQDAATRRNYKQVMEGIRKRAVDVFGSVDALVRAVVQRTAEGEAQTKLVSDLATLTRTIVGTASDASGGEFLLPLQQVAEIFKYDQVQAGVLTYARRYNVAGRSLRIPYLKQSTTGASGVEWRPLAGIAEVTIVGEGGTKPTREPTFGQRLLTVYKWAAYSEMGDEVMADDLTGELAPSVVEAVGGQVMNAMNDKMTFTGSGTSEPLGAFHANNAAMLTSPRAGANLIAAADVFNMFVRHTHGPRSRWFVSRRALAQLFTLQVGGNTIVTYLPNLNQSPSGILLLGLPVEVCDFLPALGTQSDLVLVNPDFYACAIRQVLTVQSSIHFKFNQDITAYRFFARGGGIPIPDGLFAYRSVGTTLTDPHSPFVTLAA